VGCSSTSILIILRLDEDPSVIVSLTFLNILLALISLIDLFTRILLYGSPSSTIKEFLITFSDVIKFPYILILSI